MDDNFDKSTTETQEAMAAAFIIFEHKTKKNVSSTEQEEHKGMLRCMPIFLNTLLPSLLNISSLVLLCTL